MPFDPRQLVSSLNIDKGDVVADLGAGSGFYTLPIAELVGEEGRVYAVDIQKDLLSRIANEAKEKKLKNIHIIWGDLERVGGSQIGDLACDLVVVSNILFQIEKKEEFLKEVFRILKRSGRLLLIEWSDSFGGLGPHKEQVVSREVARALLIQNGFRILQEIEPGGHHYGFLAKKEDGYR